MRLLLLAAVSTLLTTVAVVRAQVPPVECFDTGPACINKCETYMTNNYQWCGSCHYFIQCNAGYTYYHQCAADLVWHDLYKVCQEVSTTCVECREPAPFCASTGSRCVPNCAGLTDGLYQWCGRCDYYLQCSGGTGYYQQCAPGYKFDDNAKSCVYPSSSTCFDSPCTVGLSTTIGTPPPSPISPCTPNPCANGGTCLPSGGGFICQCRPEYTGYNCFTPIDYCVSNPCLNSGTCLPYPGGYQCLCWPGYTGPRCENIINNCLSNPCLNGGTCFNGIGFWYCECLPEWTGVRCESLLNPCASFPCANGGTCYNNCGYPQCQCNPGWTGTFCEILIDNCQSKPCLNGGTCQNGINQWICICPPSFTGTVCQSAINACGSAPCLNGGTCVPNCGIFQCVCPPDWTGYRCEIPLTPCEPNPCLNGGICYVNGPDSYYCVCNIYYTGYRCESPNYIVNDTCGDLVWANYIASNGFTRLCYFWAPPEDVTGRNTECRNTIHNIPLYDNYTNLMLHGGNFGCLVSQNYPNDLPATSAIACADNYQQDVTLGAYNESARLMVCLRYPYEGIPLK